MKVMGKSKWSTMPTTTSKLFSHLSPRAYSTTSVLIIGKHGLFNICSNSKIIHDK